MDSEHSTRASAETAADPEASDNASDPSLDIAGLARTSLDMARELVDLVAIELELAARSLVLMVVLAIVLAAVAVVVWLLTLAALGVYLNEGLGLAWPWALLALAFLNLLAGFGLWQAVRKLSARLGLPGVRSIIRTPDQRPTDPRNP